MSDSEVSINPPTIDERPSKIRRWHSTDDSLVKCARLRSGADLLTQIGLVNCERQIKRSRSLPPSSSRSIKTKQLFNEPVIQFWRSWPTHEGSSGRYDFESMVSFEDGFRFFTPEYRRFPFDPFHCHPSTSGFAHSSREMGERFFIPLENCLGDDSSEGGWADDELPPGLLDDSTDTESNDSGFVDSPH